MNLKELTPYEWLKLIAIMLIIIAVGMFAINQTLGYFYKSQFLQSPCSLCVELNPRLDSCINAVNVEDDHSNIDLGNITFSYPN